MALLTLGFYASAVFGYLLLGSLTIHLVDKYFAEVDRAISPLFIIFWPIFIFLGALFVVCDFFFNLPKYIKKIEKIRLPFFKKNSISPAGMLLNMTLLRAAKHPENISTDPLNRIIWKKDELSIETHIGNREKFYTLRAGGKTFSRNDKWFTEKEIAKADEVVKQLCRLRDLRLEDKKQRNKNKIAIDTIEEIFCTAYKPENE